MADGLPTAPRAASQNDAMTTKETAARSVEVWNNPLEGRARVEPEDFHLGWMEADSEGQGTDTRKPQGEPSASPSGEPVNETSQAYRQSLRHREDATYVNVGTVCASASAEAVGQPASIWRTRGGAAVVVRARESRAHEPRIDPSDRTDTGFKAKGGSQTQCNARRKLSYRCPCKRSGVRSGRRTNVWIV